MFGIQVTVMDVRYFDIEISNFTSRTATYRQWEGFHSPWKGIMKNKMVRILKKIIRGLLTVLLLFIRLVQIEFRINRNKFKVLRPRKIQLFNLDLHTSVIADLKYGFLGFDVALVSWVISNSNINFRKIFKIKDPANGLSGKNWLEFDNDDFDVFRNRYRRYLSTFDGFIACFPPAFLELYIETGKPILVVIATRYESPYTDRQSEWLRLNDTLVQGLNTGQLIIAANNRADAEYLKYFTGIDASYVPSLCEYTNQQRNQNSGKRLIISRGGMQLRELIESQSGLSWRSPSEEFGSRFNWTDLHQVAEVFFLPYNISTMTLFELATSGVPVTVPSADLIKKLRELDPEILSELSFYQIRNLPTSDLADENPNKTSEDGVIDWWLAKADFYDLELMPNIRVISSLSELANPHPLNLEGVYEQQKVKRQNRNLRLFTQRRELLEGFLEKTASFKSLNQ